MAENAKFLFDENYSEFLHECKQALEDFASFDSLEAFSDVVSRAISLVLQYDATPDTLHLYLNGLTLPTGEVLDEAQLEFLYLQVLRFFSEHAFSEMTPEGTRGFYVKEWGETLNGCLPCVCKPLESGCACDRDAADCECHMFPNRNLYRLIWPITESGDFAYLKRQLELIPDASERLKLLISEKTEFEQSFGVQIEDTDEFGHPWPGFSTKCELEIGKLRQLAELEKSGNSDANLDADKVIISRESAERALVDADKVAALEAELKAKDEAIGGFRRLLNDLRNEISYEFGENTVLRQNAVRANATISAYENDKGETISKILENLVEILGSTNRVDTPGSNDDTDSAKSDDICSKCGKGENYEDRNLERTVLFMSVLFDSIDLDKNGSPQIDAIRIVTGYSRQTIKKIFYNNGTNQKKATDTPRAYGRDFDEVSKLFKTLGRPDLAQKALSRR